MTKHSYFPYTRSPTAPRVTIQESRLVLRKIKQKSLTSAETFTTDQVTKRISNFSNTRDFGADKLSICHLKDHGTKAIAYLTALFNDSVISNHVEFRRFGSHLLPSPSQNLALHIGQSHFSVQQISADIIRRYVFFIGNCIYLFLKTLKIY